MGIETSKPPIRVVQPEEEQQLQVLAVEVPGTMVVELVVVVAAVVVERIQVRLVPVEQPVAAAVAQGLER